MNTEVRKLARLEERLTRAGAIAARQHEGPTAVGSVAAKDRARAGGTIQAPEQQRHQQLVPHLRQGAHCGGGGTSPAVTTLAPAPISR